jgi:glycosyltransferase involved in cell wall biosynthesis
MESIAIVTNSLSGGGAERAMNLLADNLGKFEDLNVLLIPINAGPRDLVEPSCDITEINRVWNGGIWDTIKAFVRFQNAILKFRPKVIILNCDLPEFYSALAIWRAKCIIVEHTTRPWSKRNSLGWFVRAILKARGANYVRVSERIRTYPIFKNALTIPNIIDPSILKRYPQLIADSDSQGRLLFIGRTSREKRPDLFAELAKNTGFASVLIGDGVLRESLQKEFQDIDNLKFLGQQIDPWRFANQNDLLVVTSDYEGDGLVALEAVSLRIPVALRDTPDCRRMGFPENNYFEDLPTLIFRLKSLGKSQFSISESEKERLLANRNPESVTQSWLKLLKSLGLQV